MNNNSTNRYDPMPADYGDDGEIVALVGAGKVAEVEPVKEEKSEEKPVKKAVGRPKKAAAVSEDEQGTTAKD